MGPVNHGVRGGGALGLSLLCPPRTLPQALRLRRSVEGLESWLEPVEVTLRAPILGWDQPGLDELLGTQGGLEAAVDRQAGQVQLLLGQAQVLTREGHCLAPDLEDRAQKLLRR